MEDSWEDLVSNWEKGNHDLFNQSHENSFNEEEFLRDVICQQPDSTPESGSPSSIPSSSFTLRAATAINTINSGLSFDETNLDEHGALLKSCSSSNSMISLEKPSSSSSPTSYILNFDNSNNEPVYTKHDSTLTSSKRRPWNPEIELRAHQRTKRVRNSSMTEAHIMAERKRRQELTQSIISLSAAIPGLKKTDKAYVLREAVNYVKQLQERVRELESQNGKGCVDSKIFIKKTHHCTNGATLSCETNTDGCFRHIEELPDVEARVLQKDVLIGIHCEKPKGNLLKIMSVLNNLHLSITSTSVLPFGTSTVQITIIAQMDDEYNMTMDDLVKTLRQRLLTLKSLDMQR